VDVQVRGLRSSLARLSGADLRAQVDLAQLPAGETVVRLGPDSVVAPRDVTVLRVSPSRLHLALEPVVTGVLKVVPRLTGAPEQGYRVTAVAVNPPVVGVRGPRSEVSGRSEIQTLPIDVTGVAGQVTRSVELEPPGGAVRFATTRTVDVTVLVREDNKVGERRSTR
jgi:YbbR domain-containing protein